MPRCCSCNSSGRCLRCACVQGGRNCGNCVPSNHDRCANQPQNGTRSQTVTTNDPHPQLLETNRAAREADGTLSPSYAGVHTADFPSTPTGVTPGPASLGDLVVEREPQSTPSTPSRIHELPPYSPSSQPTFTWGQLDGRDFSRAITTAYDEVVHWSRNLFLVPSGNGGKDFVTELARLFRSYAEASALESAALKAAMVMPHLLLQKPFASSKAKDHCEQETWMDYCAKEG